MKMTDFNKRNKEEGYRLFLLSWRFVSTSEHILLREKCTYLELFWSAFSRIRIEYGEILRISLYLVRMRKNADQKSFEYGQFSRSVSSQCSNYILPENVRKPWKHKKLEVFWHSHGVYWNIGLKWVKYALNSAHFLNFIHLKIVIKSCSSQNPHVFWRFERE